MSNDYGIKVSKPGVDVNTASFKDLIYSSQFDSMKIKKTGLLDLVMASETFGGAPSYETSRIHEATLAIDTGDIPIFLPRVSGMVAYLPADVTSGGSYNVNNLEEQDIPIYGYGDMVLEWVDVLETTTQLKLRVTRFNLTGTDITFGARTASLYYTIFHNRADMEINLL